MFSDRKCYEIPRLMREELHTYWKVGHLCMRKPGWIFSLRLLKGPVQEDKTQIQWRNHFSLFEFLCGIEKSMTKSSLHSSQIVCLRYDQGSWQYSANVYWMPVVLQSCLNVCFWMNLLVVLSLQISVPVNFNFSI